MELTPAAARLLEDLRAIQPDYEKLHSVIFLWVFRSSE